MKTVVSVLILLRQLSNGICYSPSLLIANTQLFRRRHQKVRYFVAPLMQDIPVERAGTLQQKKVGVGFDVHDYDDTIFGASYQQRNENAGIVAYRHNSSVFRRFCSTQWSVEVRTGTIDQLKSPMKVQHA
jgi:hypothetical protein